MTTRPHGERAGLPCRAAVRAKGGDLRRSRGPEAAAAPAAAADERNRGGALCVSWCLLRSWDASAAILRLAMATSSSSPLDGVTLSSSASASAAAARPREEGWVSKAEEEVATCKAVVGPWKPVVG
uniref:Uncharacterized protein n=1 Tax=Oryza meridionalis TaxID=40149 RepID=A0A0E0DM99_9ORYZ